MIAGHESWVFEYDPESKRKLEMTLSLLDLLVQRKLGKACDGSNRYPLSSSKHRSERVPTTQANSQRCILFINTVSRLRKCIAHIGNGLEIFISTNLPLVDITTFLVPSSISVSSIDFLSIDVRVIRSIVS